MVRNYWLLWIVYSYVVLDCDAVLFVLSVRYGVCVSSYTRLMNLNSGRKDVLKDILIIRSTHKKIIRLTKNI
jgi:hypothetical protein